MKLKSKRIAVTLLSLGLLLGLTACGVKAPPLPPLEAGRLAIPADVTLTPDGQGQFLKWSYPEGEGILVPQAFEISEAQRSAEECQDCPLTFTAIEKTDGSARSFFVTPEPEVDSYYRVRALGEGGQVGEVSKSLKVEKTAP